MTETALTIEALEARLRTLVARSGGYPAYGIKGEPFLPTWANMKRRGDVDAMNAFLRPLEDGGGVGATAGVGVYEPLPRPYANN